MHIFIFGASQTNCTRRYQSVFGDQMSNYFSMNRTSQSRQLSWSQCSYKKKLDSESQKKRIIKKIILISSMNKDTAKIFLKLIECEPGNYPSSCKEGLKNYSQTILDKDRQKEMELELQTLYRTDSTQQSNECFLRLIKYFILSPVEKTYILKIENELKEEQQLDTEIQRVQTLIEKEKQNKLQQSRAEIGRHKDPSEAEKRELLNHENKLERANQKLNEICASNNRLREKINQLRKQKNVMEEIYSKLKKQLEDKKENVQATIKSAGQAYCARNQAEADLKQLKQNAEQQREAFRTQCQKLNKQIQYDLRFKQFIKSKQKEKESLSRLEEQIRLNQESIELKKESNLKIDSEYRESVEKQLQIKKSFERIKKEIGISQVGIQNSGKELLNVFVGLYEKNTIMTNFVNDLNRDVEQLQTQIAAKKADIQQACLKGTADCDNDKGKEDLKTKLDIQERKKAILKAQYDRSLETIGLIKQYLQEVFQAIDVDKDTIDRLKNSSITEENLVQFLGQIQKRGLQAISLYSKLVGDQLRVENNDGNDLEEHISDLNNIVTYENSANMNSGNPLGQRTVEYPSELILKIRQDEQNEEKIDQSKKASSSLLHAQEFRKFALESLENFSKKTNNQVHRDKNIASKKFTTVTASKSKPKK